MEVDVGSVVPFRETVKEIAQIKLINHCSCCSVNHVQGTLSSLFQNPSSKASTVWHLAFFTVHLSQPYVTTGKTVAFTIWTFVHIVAVMSLLFNTLSRFVIAFLPRSKHLLISWLQLPSAVILEPKKRKSVTTSTFSPSICHEVMSQMPWS